MELTWYSASRKPAPRSVKDRWRSKDKSETKETFTIVTTEPSKFAAQFHNRMPLVLEPDTWDLCLKGDPETAAALMKPANDDVLGQ